MSINRRTATAVRSIGVVSAAAALAMGVAGNAFACSIGDFRASATCDTATGQGSITVVDTDATRPVSVTVFQNGSQVTAQTFEDQGTGTFVVPLNWSPNTKYTVHVTVTTRVDSDISGGVTTPSEACAAPTPSSSPTTPTASPSPSSASPSSPATGTPSSPATSPSSTASSSAPAAAGTNAPSPAAGGSQSLAETGGGSDTGLIAAIAAALVAVGAGSVFALRRRNPAARH